MKKDEKIALITGITGQDGSYLADYLLKLGYIVHGLKRRSSSLNTERIDHLYKDPHEKNVKFFLHYSDLTDSTNIIRLIQKIQPDEIYNLAAMSHVHVSFDTPEYTGNADGIGTLRILEAIRLLGLCDKSKFYQASTSELYGKVLKIPQDEDTPFYPRSPYGVAKLYAFWITKNYREAYNIFASNGILFNHESPVRGETFVTRKITRAIAQIACNIEKKLYVGNLNAKRDWGHAKDYVRAMHLILQYREPTDFVIATGVTTSVREFIQKSFNVIGVTICFKDEEVNEKGYIERIDEELFFSKTGRKPLHLNKDIPLIEIDPRYFRPSEVDLLQGDSSKARKLLHWQPNYSLDAMIKEMVEHDLMIAKRTTLLNSHGFNEEKNFEM